MKKWVAMQRHQGEAIPQHHLQAGTSNSTLARPPLIGRSTEMDQLAARLSRAAGGQGCAMFLAGEAGIGKTYTLTHPLIQEVAYAERPEMARRRAHAVFATVLERVRPDDLDRLARHYHAAGSQADTGSPLAHASLAAREYGIPAVVGSGNATARLQDGQIVTIDGNTGLVEVQG